MKQYYRTELHAHTKPGSICSDIEPADLVHIYKENGYDSIVLTNHFLTKMHGETAEENVKWYLEDYEKCCEAGARIGIHVILAAEVRFDENHNDYLVFGISPDDLITIYRMLPYGIDRFYQEFKNERNVIIQAHPFRDRSEIANPRSLDGIEVFNLHPNHNSRIGVAAKFAHEHQMIVTCGSDFHHYGQECQCAMLTETPMKDSYDIANVLKKGEHKIAIGNYLVSL